MRLGVMGSAQGNVRALEASARFLLEDMAVDRAVYLGIDGALDGVIARWAEELVGGNPSTPALWERATERCLTADAKAIDAFLEAERARRSLRVFESLLDEQTRAVEMVGGALAVMIYDKGDLTEEDMLPARILLFGNSTKSVVRQVGQRWFLSPGSFDEGGILTLEDRDDGIILAFFDVSGHELQSQRLSLSKTTKLKVSGADA